MGFAGSQGADLTQANHDGSYSYYLEMEGGMSEPASGSLNIPWLVGLMTSQGNAMTQAIGRNAVVFSEPEWGNDSSGMGSAGGYSGMGSVGGGLTVSW